MNNIDFIFPESIELMDSVTKWDYHFLQMAELIANKSRDPSTKVGSVIVDEWHRIISTGYNGLPQKLKDKDIILNDRDLKLKQIIHAEENAIIFAKQDLTNCSIYVWPMMSCSSCASKVIQSGITTIITVSDENPRWQQSFDISIKTFIECGVNIKRYSLKSYKNLKGC